MADPTGFLNHTRQLPTRRPVPLRLRDYRELYDPVDPAAVRVQASRCMDCGIPFCHNGCPLGNLIPEWNDLARTGRWDAAADRLHATNNFPEFTGRLCPAPCEAACVVGLADDPVAIKLTEQQIADRIVGRGLKPQPAKCASGKKVAVVGSGPAGLAAAQQLARAGHEVTVMERDSRPGGLMRYGIPEFKMEKVVLDRRLAQLRAEGVRFITNCEVGRDITAERLTGDFDAVILAVGARVGRDLPVPGRELAGIYLAMDYLSAANRVCEGSDAEFAIDAAGKRVVIIGGGDTGADCFGTALRQGAVSVTQLEITPQPPPTRDASTPWPTYPLQLRTSAAHEEGGQRMFWAATTDFVGQDGQVTGLHLSGGKVLTSNDPLVTADQEDLKYLDADLVLLAMGFTGPETALAQQLGVAEPGDGRIARDTCFMTSKPGVFVAGDAGRGQSLIVWAIAEGRAAAAAAHQYLTGSSDLPAPIAPTTMQLR